MSSVPRETRVQPRVRIERNKGVPPLTIASGLAEASGKVKEIFPNLADVPAVDLTIGGEFQQGRYDCSDMTAVDRIIEYGEIFIDEDDPLDLDGIDDEERRFWSESWDEPRGEW